MRLLITRHGQTTWNLEHRYQGQGDSALTAEGEKQAKLLAARLADERIDAVISSDLRRAWRTAELITDGRAMAILRDSAWRESAYGAWEGFTRDEIHARDPEALRRRTADLVNVAPPGGENLRALERRVLGAVNALRRHYAGKTVLVVTHVGPLLVLACHVHGVDLGNWQSQGPANCGLSCVRWDASSHSIEYWDDVRHLIEHGD